MRSLLVFLAILGYLAPVFKRPYIGALVWIWIAVGTPHLETYGLAKTFQLNLVVAVVTLFCWLLYKKNVQIYKTAPMILLYVLIVIMFIATYTGPAPDYSSRYLVRTLKIFMLAIVVIGLVDNRVRIHACLWVLTISLGYYAAKAGLGTIASGGSFRVSGPIGGPIADNNHTAAAFIMILPIMNYIRLESRSKLVRLAMIGVMVTALFGIMGTYSRGGFIGVCAMLCFYWLRSKGKVRNATLVLVLLAIGASFMPQSYYDRLSTIETADEEDDSFKGRLAAWQTALTMSQQRIFGVGFRGYEVPSVFVRYKPADFGQDVKAMHSVYFEVLADIGYPGLICYLAICFTVWLNLIRIMHATATRPELRWANNCARMIEISFAGFAVAGAALSMAYFEPLWILIALVIALRSVVDRSLAKEEAETKRPKWLPPKPEGKLAPAE